MIDFCCFCHSFMHSTNVDNQREREDKDRKITGKKWKPNYYWIFFCRESGRFLFVCFHHYYWIVDNWSTAKMITTHYSTMTNSGRYGNFIINKIIIITILLSTIINISNSIGIDSTIRPLNMIHHHHMNKMLQQSSTTSILPDHNSDTNIIVDADNNQDENNHSSSSVNIIFNKRLQNCWTNLSGAINLVCSKSSSSSKFIKLLKENYVGKSFV